MTRERVKELLPVMQAFAEGKPIQYKAIDTGRWCDWNYDVGSDCSFSDNVEYRIKPEENYTIEQDCGENRIEGGVLSVSGMVSAELNELCKWCKGKSCNCGTCSNKDKENSYYLLHKDKFPEQKEKHYRPFEDTAELMVHYSKHFNIDFPPFYEPIIWVKRKDNDPRFLITGYDEHDVFVEDCYMNMTDLFEMYVFLDGSCVGKESE